MEIVDVGINFETSDRGLSRIDRTAGKAAIAC